MTDVPEGYQFDHVIKRVMSGRPSTDRYHLADPEALDEPRCDHELQAGRSEWARAAPDEIRSRVGLCQDCDPNYDREAESIHFDNGDGVVSEIGADACEDALEDNANVVEAAQALGISPQGFLTRLGELGVGYLIAPTPREQAAATDGGER